MVQTANRSVHSPAAPTQHYRPPIQVAIKDQVRDLAREGFGTLEIAGRTGISKRSVNRILDARRILLGEAPKRKGPERRPLYDPHRDGAPELTITATLMGDPPPGRRELLARVSAKITDPTDCTDQGDE
jgi:hypothetical protein